MVCQVSQVGGTGFRSGTVLMPLKSVHNDGKKSARLILLLAE